MLLSICDIDAAPTNSIALWSSVHLVHEERCSLLPASECGAQQMAPDHDAIRAQSQILQNVGAGW
jgi:hypothetical protein